MLVLQQVTRVNAATLKGNFNCRGHTNLGNPISNRLDDFDHALAQLCIGKPTVACCHVIDHVLEFGGGRYDAGYVRMRGNKFQKKLAPTGAVELGCPIG